MSARLWRSIGGCENRFGRVCVLWEALECRGDGSCATNFQRRFGRRLRLRAGAVGGGIRRPICLRARLA